MRFVGIKLCTPHGELSKRTYTHKVVGSEECVRDGDLVVVSTKDKGFALGVVDDEYPEKTDDVEEIVVRTLGNSFDVYMHGQRLKNTNIKEKVLKKINMMTTDELIEFYGKME